MEHGILATEDPRSPVSPFRVAEATCSPCHESAKLNVKYDLPSGRLQSYVDSYHGLKSRAGDRTVANCSSCHMPDATADPVYASSRPTPNRTGDLPIHQFAGGNMAFGLQKNFEDFEPIFKFINVFLLKEFFKLLFFQVMNSFHNHFQ